MTHKQALMIVEKFNRDGPAAPEPTTFDPREFIWCLGDLLARSVERDGTGPASRETIDLKGLALMVTQPGMPLWILGWHDENRSSVDIHYGFVMAAGSEKEARAEASQQSGDENPGPRRPWVLAGSSPWLDPAVTYCRMISPTSTFTETKVVLRDFNAG